MICFLKYKNIFVTLSLKNIFSYYIAFINHFLHITMKTANGIHFYLHYPDVNNLFFNLFFFFWRPFSLQYCGGFHHAFTWISHGCTCVPHPEPPSYLPPHPIPQSHPNAPALSTLCHASNLDWWSISQMIIHRFQWYFLKSSHPCLLPQSPKDWSLHLFLFCCLAYRFIVTMFLNSVYMHKYTVLVFFFLTYFTLYNRLQFHPPH